jgi:predicted nucleic acid-binding protein
VTVVVDSSATLAWVYDDERTRAIERVFDVIIETSAWVPIIWHLEIANGLQTGIRQRRIDAAFRTRTLSDLASMEFTVDGETNVFAWNDTLVIAERFRLTPYDACYLELAQRRVLPLATLDKDLRKAAKALDIPLLGV